jgi:hypothetical protein
MMKTNQPVTLGELAKSTKIDPAQITANALDVYVLIILRIKIDTQQADNTFQRFDNFNAKYSPFGKSELRNVFLKTENHLKVKKKFFFFFACKTNFFIAQGRYFAEIIHELIRDMDISKYVKKEWRISIYGRSRNFFFF